MRLLAAGHSVLESGALVGLESPTSFAGMFKKFTGHTPSYYQRQQMLKRNEMLQSPLHFVPNCFAETHGWGK